MCEVTSSCVRVVSVRCESAVVFLFFIQSCARLLYCGLPCCEPAVVFILFYKVMCKVTVLWMPCVRWQRVISVRCEPAVVLL